MSKLKAIGALFVAMFALGTQVAHASTWKNNTTITKVQFGSNGAVFFQLASGTTGESCGGNDWAIYAADNTGFAQQIQALLTAYMSGRTVNVNLNNCVAYPSGGTTYPIPRYFEINP